jgi:Flp pilus assembly protein TadG
MDRTILGTHRRPRQRRSPGQALVEFAIVLPIMLVLAAVAIDAGRLFFAYVTIESAAKEGALYGATRPQCDVASTDCPDPSNVAWHLSQDLSGLTSTSRQIECIDAASGLSKSVSSCGSGDTYRVSVSYPFSPITPVAGTFLGNVLTLRSTESAVVLNSSWITATPTPSPTPTLSPSPSPSASPSPSPSACIAPTISFTADPISGTGPFDVTFSGTSNGEPIRWQWDFGDGASTSTDDTAPTETVTHTYAAVHGTKNYDVALTVNTGATCSTTFTLKNLIQVK